MGNFVGGGGGGGGGGGDRWNPPTKKKSRISLKSTQVSKPKIPLK